MRRPSKLLGRLVAATAATAIACAAEVRPTRPPAPAGPPEPFEYHVWVDPELRSLQSRVCFPGPPPAGLSARAAEPGSVRFARRAGSGERLDVRDGTIDLSGMDGPGCVEYGVSLEKLRHSPTRTRGAAVGRDLLAPPESWLFGPTPSAPDARATLQLHLPAGLAAALPWPAVDGRPDTYELRDTAFRWRSHAAFGRFELEEVSVAAAQFRIAVLDREKGASAAGIRNWLSTAGETVAQLYGGRFPVPEVTLIVVPLPGPGGPVHFGHVTRGGGAAIVLLLSAHASDEALPGEWVAIHEMLHLGMPYVRPVDAWLSEGFVTYYTQVLRARAGVMPGGAPGLEPQAQRALEHIHDGLSRARRSARGQTLEHVSANMHRSGAYSRVYWGGAAIAFESDVAIRHASGGARSLDDAMRAIQPLCRTPRVWRAQAVLERMDRALAGVLGPEESVTRIARRHLESRALPELGESFERLGVRARAGAGAVEIAADAPPGARELREGLFSR